MALSLKAVWANSELGWVVYVFETAIPSSLIDRLSIMLTILSKQVEETTSLINVAVPPGSLLLPLRKSEQG